MMKRILFILTVTATFLASCGTHKKIAEATPQDILVATTDTEAEKLAQMSREYVGKVHSNAAAVTNIVSKIDFTLEAMGKDVSVDGKIYMRKNEVIRIVLAPFGLMEVGRIEFTPQYVLVMDRMNKEYVKATYSDLDFLKDNGLDFYSLQSLFWNELFLPGKQKITADNYANYEVDMKAPTNRTIKTKSGKLHYVWTTDPKTALIKNATVNYAPGTAQASTAQWNYDKFTSLGNKQFPLFQTLSFSTKSMKAADRIKMDIQMKKISSDSDWETNTSVSSKYKEIKANDIIKKLVNFK